MVKDVASQLQNLHVNSHKFFLLFSTLVRLVCQKFCARCVPKMLTGVHKMGKKTSSLVDFLEQNQKDGDEFLSRIIPLTGEQTYGHRDKIST
jgi:hypothetical protein